MSYNRNPSKKWNAFLLMLGILMLGTVAGRYAVHRQAAVSAPPPATVEKSSAPISLTGVRHTAIKGGKSAWSLTSKSAEYQIDRKEVDFKQLHVVFFQTDGNDIDLAADSGIGQTELNDLEVTGGVVVKTSKETLKTEMLSYIHEKRTLISKATVILSSDLINATADQMTHHLDTGLTELNGKVFGTIGKKREQ